MLSDDLCYEIVGYLDSCTILNTCSLLSKQWLEVIRTRSHISVELDGNICDERITSMMKSQFLDSIQSVKVKSGNNSGSIGYLLNSLCLMRNLQELYLVSKELDSNDAQVISEMKSLTKLDLNGNRISDEGVDFISKMSEDRFKCYS